MFTQTYLPAVADYLAGKVVLMTVTPHRELPFSVLAMWLRHSGPGFMGARRRREGKGEGRKGDKDYEREGRTRVIKRALLEPGQNSIACIFCRQFYSEKIFFYILNTLHSSPNDAS